MKKLNLIILLIPLWLGLLPKSYGAKLVEVRVIDKDYIMIYFKDGEVTFVNDNQQLFRYGNPLNTANAVIVGNWTIRSADDANYGSTGRNPLNAYRKTKENGLAQYEWTGSDFRYDNTIEHTIYLKLPFSMVQGKTYTLTINSNTNSDVTSRTFKFDIFNNVSEAIHVNLTGYTASDLKAADLYIWMGNGGARDYSSFQGRKVYMHNVNTQQSQEVGTVSFWKASAAEGVAEEVLYNFTQSPVWKIDFTNFTQTGTFRLVVDGVGASQPFRIADDVYKDPFDVSLKGFLYMRLGQRNPTNISPAPRTPLYIPGVSPSDTRVYITTLTPFQPEWNIGKDTWDAPEHFANFVKPGMPQNNNAWGGHADAADDDRHIGHITMIYDLLLPYILTKGALSDDNTGIPESGNGIADVIDEAKYEVDFWLRLRDGKGYAHGVTIKAEKVNVFYQAGTTAIAAWANAANSAMLAEAYRIAGKTSLMNQYRDSAIVAYKYAGSLANQQLDVIQDAGYAQFRGRDLKMLAAAYLFNVTGNTAYEDVINAESVVKSSTSQVMSKTMDQLWATVAYLTTNRTVRYPTLLNNMKASMIHQAKVREANNSLSRPSRRSVPNDHMYFQTIQNIHHTIIAHSLTTSQAEKDFFLNAMLLEYSWGLGRNPLNMIQMTTASTKLASKRSVENMYTSGKEDGVTGLHPGHTPYLNTQDWRSCGMVMGCAPRLLESNYPTDEGAWPKGELYYNVRYVWNHSEYTPQQTMRGKMALYGYLRALGGQSTNPPPADQYTLSITATNGTVGKNPNKATYNSGETVILTATPNSGYTFTGWSGNATGTTNPLTITMNGNKTITANFSQASGPCNNRQAETSYTGSGVALDTKHSGYTDSGYIDFGGLGSYAEWTVNVASAGSYTLKFRHANDGSTGNRQSEVRVNGTAQGNVAFASTGSWTTWSVVDFRVNLNAGNNVVRLTANTTAGGTNLDSYEVCGGQTSSGYAVREYWNNVQGLTVAEIPVNTSPTGTSNITSLSGPADIGDYYGTRVRGYITAPTSGSYTFWITGDDNVEFWLSSNSQASGKVRIAYHTSYSSSTEWNKYPTQKSSARTLTAGQKYYFEVYHKEGNGGDNWSVGWAKPGQATTLPSEIIPGSQLSPFASTTTARTAQGESATNDFEIYPVPASDILNIKGLPTEGDKVIRVANMEGKQMLEKAIGPNEETSIDISSFANGFYLISVSSGNKILYRKLLVNR